LELIRSRDPHVASSVAALTRSGARNQKMLSLIDKALGTGIANDRSEFIRMAVAEKLEKMGPFFDEVNDFKFSPS
jgi:hypothetical protein